MCPLGHSTRMLFPRTFQTPAILFKPWRPGPMGPKGGLLGFASSNADVGNRVNKSHVPGPDAQKTELNSSQPLLSPCLRQVRWRTDSGRPMRKVRLRAGKGRRGTEAATTARHRGRHQRHTQSGNHSSPSAKHASGQGRGGAAPSRHQP